MKYSLLINALLLSFCCSIARADLVFTKEGLSPEAQDFADRRIAAYCLLARSHKNINDKCKVTHKSQRIEAELVNRIGPRFLGHIDLRKYQYKCQKDKHDKYVVWAQQLLPSTEWVKLTNYPDPHVRVSAFQALVVAYPKEDIAFIIRKHLNDEDMIDRALYDELLMQKVSDVFREIGTYSQDFQCFP